MITNTTPVGSTPITHTDPRRVRAERAGFAQNEESLSTQNAVGLQNALATNPEIRPEVIARAEKLAVDLNYPPRQIIEGIAHLIALSRDPSIEQK